MCAPFAVGDNVHETAQKVFNIPYLYPWQRMVIAHIMDAYQNEERGGQIVLLPTGAGKSLCFMIPAVLLPGATLIIYPLLALMNDQLGRLKKLDLDAVVLRGGQSAQEREECFKRIKTGTRFILTNPETLQNGALVERLAECGIAHVAVDEAHCVSEWGDSFRPAYTTLGTIIQKLHCKTTTAFTATASDTVLNRINEILFAGSAYIMRGETDRPNIRYYVMHTAFKQNTLIEAAASEKRPLIVFCASRTRCAQLAHVLRDFLYRRGERDTVKFYHAGLTREERENTEQWFYPKMDGILVSTCAFGMGVDKKDIRTVIHYDAPDTAEAYVQEAGRAGRDGSPAKAVLLWSPQDGFKAKDTDASSRARVIADFAQSGMCRRNILLKALGCEETSCAGCDVCEKNAVNSARDADDFIRFIHKNRKRYSKQEAVQAFCEKQNRLSAEKLEMRIWEAPDVSELLNFFIKTGTINPKKDFYRAASFFCSRQ